VSAYAIANCRIVNPDGYAECPHYALQGEVPARTDLILDRLNVVKEQGQC
jgi:hypothetical protein